MKRVLMRVNTFLYVLLIAAESYYCGIRWGSRVTFAEKSHQDMTNFFAENFGKHYYFWIIVCLLFLLVSLWMKRHSDELTEKAFLIMGACTFPAYAYMSISGIIKHVTEGPIFYIDNCKYIYHIVTLILVTLILANDVICAVKTVIERRQRNKRSDSEV